MHNSGWVQSPGTAVVTNPTEWDRLERYVGDMVATFGNDERVLAWDLYNEPGNNGLGDKSLPLLAETFLWARAAKAKQPLTVGVWFDNPTLNAFQLEASDIISFHNYNKADSLRKEIEGLQKIWPADHLHGIHGTHTRQPVRDEFAHLQRGKSRLLQLGLCQRQDEYHLPLGVASRWA